MLGVGGRYRDGAAAALRAAAARVRELDMKAVSGITMVQVLAAAASGVVAHHRMRAVHGELAGLGGLSMAAGSFVGRAWASRFLTIARCSWSSG
jgi:uncharacterized membrane protein YfcA